MSDAMWEIGRRDTLDEAAFIAVERSKSETPDAAKALLSLAEYLRELSDAALPQPPGERRREMSELDEYDEIVAMGQRLTPSRAYNAGLLKAAAMAEEEAERQRGFADEAERKCMGGSAASHSSAGQLMAAFARRLRAEAGEG